MNYNRANERLKKNNKEKYQKRKKTYCIKIETHQTDLFYLVINLKHRSTPPHTHTYTHTYIQTNSNLHTNWLTLTCQYTFTPRLLRTDI